MSEEKQTKFNPYDVELYDDFEKVKLQAEEYIYRILFGIHFFEHYNRGVKPMIFMSMDIMNIIGRATRDIQCVCPGEKYLVCGCPIKRTMGENELYIGFDLLENRHNQQNTVTAESAIAALHKVARESKDTSPEDFLKLAINPTMHL